MTNRLARMTMAAFCAWLLVLSGTASADSLDFENPNGLSAGTEWMSEDFGTVQLGSSSSTEAVAEVNPWAINDSRLSGGPPAWTLSVDLAGIPDSDAWVYLPVPIFTAAPATPASAVVTGVPTAPVKINNTGGFVLGTNTGGGGGYYTVSFATPLRARIFPTATVSSLSGVWTVSLL